MAGYIKVISSLLLVYVISLNTTNGNRKVELHHRHKRIFKRYGTTPQNKGHGQIRLTWGGINIANVLLAILDSNPALLIDFLRFSSEYKYFFNRYVGIVSKSGLLEGWHNSGADDRAAVLSLGVGLEWSYNGTGNNSKIDNTYYGGSIGVLGLWGGINKDTGKAHDPGVKDWDVQVRLTPFKMRKSNGLYMSVDVGCLDVRGLRNNKWVMDGIIAPTLFNLAINMGWSWWIVPLNTTNWNREITNENKGHGQICITWGGMNGVSVFFTILGSNPSLLLYLLRFSPEYKYFLNSYVGIVSRVGVFDGWYYGKNHDHLSILSLGVGLEWSYNGTGSSSRIDNTYYGGSIGVLGLWGNTIDGSNKFTFESKKFGVQVRLTPFKICKPNGLYMSVDFGALDIRGLKSNDWVMDGIVNATGVNMAFNIGWSWWI